jgi:carboxylesterase
VEPSPSGRTRPERVLDYRLLARRWRGGNGGILAGEGVVKESHRIKSGAEPYSADGGPLGILLIHGFTGSPASLRPMAEFLAQEGLSVSLPRLPGHGTDWEDLARTSWEDWYSEADAAFGELAARRRDVVVVALSMGSSLAVHMAATRGDEVRGLALINPYLVDPRLLSAPLVRLFTRTTKGVVNDMKKPGQDEVGYERVPVAALPSLRRLLRVAQKDLPRVRAPLILFKSTVDHVVKPAGARLIMQRIGSEEKELVELANSFHVATLDHDAELIEQRVLEFARTRATPGS